MDYKKITRKQWGQEALCKQRRYKGYKELQTTLQSLVIKNKGMSLLEGDIPKPKNEAE